LVREVDMAFEQMATLSGPGSTQARTTLLHDLFAAATTEEQAWLRGAIAGEVRQGALDALVQEAIAAAAELPVSLVRRAAMLTGSTPEVAVLALTEGEAGLRTVSLRVGRPIQPMLASSAPDVAAAVAKAGPGEVAVDAKLDGIRIQVHRHGDLVSIATRSLDDITSRLPGVVELVRTFPGDRFVLDGEALLIADDGRPRPFQETAPARPEPRAVTWRRTSSICCTSTAST
jgi:DNA ligase-1